MPETSPSTLAAALAALDAAAAAAGVDPGVARAEGEALAATVSEAATGAYLDWSEQTGGDRSAEEFFDAASLGRRYRSGASPSVAALARPPPRPSWAPYGPRRHRPHLLPATSPPCRARPGRCSPRTRCCASRRSPDGR